MGKIGGEGRVSGVVVVGGCGGNGTTKGRVKEGVMVLVYGCWRVYG